MKHKSIIKTGITMVALLTLSWGTFAQDYYSNQVNVDNLIIAKKIDQTTINMDLNLDQLTIDKNDLVILTPYIVSNSGANQLELAPVAILGKLRNKILQRPFTWKGKTEINVPENYQLIRKNGTSQTIQYTANLPYNEWQRDAQLLLKTVVIGCADCMDSEPNIILSDRVLAEKFVPEYQFTYLVPKAEEIKQRSETYSAHLNYPVGKWNLLTDFQNNAAELSKVGSIIRELKNDADLTISDFTITGYASPEGSRESNLLLSRRRAESFVKHIETTYGYNTQQFSVQWMGEDWDGLQQAVAASPLANKDEIMQIIHSVTDVDARDAHIWALDDGITYNRLLNEFYPPLRRNDYTIAFISRPFDVKEAAKVIKTRPKLLSLNEMFHVANTFPAESQEFREVFEIAARTFPESTAANINVAITELRDNKGDAALARLEKSKDTPEAWNLIGVAYAQKGMHQQAAEYFKKAIARGDKEATHNMQQLTKLLEDN